MAGVCGDLKDWFSGNPELAVYVPYQQWPNIYMELHVRTRQDPLQLAASVRAQVRMVDRNQAVSNINTEEQSLAEQTSGVRMAAARMSVYAAISLLLAVMGCYAVGAFSVARRTQEIGIRMTLGATRINILRMVLTQTARMTAIGLFVGLSLAIALTQIMSHALYQRSLGRANDICGFDRAAGRLSADRRLHSGLSRSAHRSDGCLAQ